MRINTNTAAMNTYSNLTSANASKSSSLAKLSSGLRINKAGDDAAGLAISEKMKNQVSGMTQASRNAQDGISLIQTAEGALSETHSILNRMRDLTVQAGNGTNTKEDKDAIQKEINSLTEEVDRIAKDTQFNTKGLLDGTTEVTVKEANTATGTFEESILTDEAGITAMLEKAELTASTSGADASANLALDKTALKDKFNSATNEEKAGLIAAYNDKAALAEAIDTKEYVSTDAVTKEATSFTFQIGANAGENIKIDIANMTTEGLGIEGLDITGEGYVATETDADGNDLSATDAALKTIDSAIKSVSEERANLGAVQNRLDHTVSNLATTKENLSEANSRIVDVDMAEEMMSFTKSNILSQASTSMLAQANQMPQSVLSLLQ